MRDVGVGRFQTFPAKSPVGNVNTLESTRAPVCIRSLTFDACCRFLPNRAHLSLYCSHIWFRSLVMLHSEEGCAVHACTVSPSL